MDYFAFENRLLSKLKTNSNVGNDLSHYLYNVIVFADKIRPEINEALFHARKFSGNAKSGHAVCYLTYSESIKRDSRKIESIVNNLRESCKRILEYVGKPNNPRNELGFFTFKLKVKEMSSSDDSEYAVLATMNTMYCQFTSDFQVTLTEENDVKLEFTITLDRVF